MRRSPGPTFSLAGTRKPITSTSPSTCSTRWFSRSPSSVRGLCRPGVSTMTSWPAGRFRMPRIARRVVCGLSEVIATFSPTSAFVSVDLPTLGRPTKVTNPDRPSTGPPTAGSDPASAVGSFSAIALPLLGLRRLALVRRGLRHGDGLGPRARDMHLAGARSRTEVLLRCLQRLAALDEDGGQAPPAPARCPAGQHQPRVLGRRTGLRHTAESLAEQPADRVDVLVVEVDAEQVADLVEAEACAHPEPTGLELHRLLGARIVLVGDLADELLDEVFEGHEARHAAVLVHDEADVNGVALHLLQERLGLHRLRHEHGATGDAVDRGVAPAGLVAEPELHEVFEVQHPDDAIGVGVDDGDA